MPALFFISVLFLIMENGELGPAIELPAIRIVFAVWQRIGCYRATFAISLLLNLSITMPLEALDPRIPEKRAEPADAPGFTVITLIILRLLSQQGWPVP